MGYEKGVALINVTPFFRIYTYCKPNRASTIHTIVNKKVIEVFSHFFTVHNKCNIDKNPYFCYIKSEKRKY